MRGRDMGLPKAALIQFSGAFDKQKNLEKAKKYVAEAAENGAQIVCLQELFNTTYFCYTEEPSFWDLAEPIPGPAIDEAPATP
jgi:N-carbamoylputrescine amidase